MSNPPGIFPVTVAGPIASDVLFARRFKIAVCFLATVRTFSKILTSARAVLFVGPTTPGLNIADKDSFGEKMKGKILLVDDNDEFLDSTKDVLETEGYQVITAVNGEDAVALAASQRFNIVLMDIKMPGLNGVESFLKMKAQNPDVKVILLTAYFMEDLILKAQAEGVLAILSKPLDMQKLLDAVATAVEKGSSCILVADDDPAFCGSLSDALQTAGYKVKAACDGDRVKHIAEAENFDILLLDMKFPPHNGLVTYRQIKRVQPDLITIIVTGYAEEMEDLIRQALDENVYTFLAKPLEMETLLAVIREGLNAKKYGEFQKPGIRKP
jgi:DNA-binding NtrC family response regulator